MPESSEKSATLRKNAESVLSRFLFLVFVLLVPFRSLFSFKLYGKVIQATDIIFLMMLSAFIFDIFRRKVKLSFSLIHLPFAVYLCAHILSLTNAQDKFQGLVETGGVFYLFLIFYIAYILIDSADFLKKFMAVWLGALCAVVVFGFIGLYEVYILKKADSLFMLINCAFDRYALMHNFMPRVSSVLGNPNMMMSYFILSLVVIVYFWNRGAKALRFFIGALLICILFLSSLTISRDILGLLIAVYLASFVTHKLNNKFTIAFRYIALILIVFLFFAFTMLTIWEPSRIGINNRSASGERSISIDFHRTNKSFYYQYALRMFKDHPFVGVGSGNYNLRLNEYYLKDPKAGPQFAEFSRNDPHSTYLGMLAETGIFGLASFLAIIWVLFVSLQKRIAMVNCRQIRDISFALVACVIGILVQALAMDVQNLRHLWVMFGLAFALCKNEYS